MNILQYSAFAAAITFLILSAPVNGKATTANKPKPASKQQPNLEQGIDQMFAALDKDKNKQISFQEFKAGVIAERKEMLIIEQLRNSFKSADKNGNSTLDAAEFSQLPGLKSMPAPKPAFADHDMNKDNKMDFREFVNFVSKMSAPPAPKK